jgi:thiosulfate/3-mercaptopyruvate sulfurtransferase
LDAYARSDVLVESAWISTHVDDPDVQLVEVNLDATLYPAGHLPHAIGWSFWEDVYPVVRRHNLARDALERLLSRSGIANTTVVAFAGDYHNCGAAFAYWLLRMFRHPALRLLNGGRAAWLAEDRPLVVDAPPFRAATYRAPEPDERIRALRDYVHASIGHPKRILVDVRSGEEYAGTVFTSGKRPQFGEVAGHIPGAIHLDWELAFRDDGTFKPAGELRALYSTAGITPDKDVITYCTVGGRSSLTWFVLSELLGYPRVLSYDGSWAEWGNLIGASVEQS